MARAGTERSEAQALVERLRERREEIEQTLLARVHSISDPAEVRDPEYAVGLRTAVSAALGYGLAAIEGRAHPETLPLELLAQARRAARGGVGLDTVLRRYVAGYTLLEDFVGQEAEAAGIRSAQGTLRAEAVLLDRLMGAVAGEYREEIEVKPRTQHQSRIECVRKLLEGELIGVEELNYDPTAWNLALIASGRSGESGLRDIARRLDFRLLTVSIREGVVWAWMGGSSRPDPEEFEGVAAGLLPTGVRVCVGEPGWGLVGWRLSHRQAAACLPVAQSESAAFTRYVNVAFLASILQDEILASSLREIYLAPLAEGGAGGTVLFATLRAYFAAERNAASAAAALGVTRQTVGKRLRSIECQLGRTLAACSTELEAAMALYDFEANRTH